MPTDANLVFYFVKTYCRREEFDFLILRNAQTIFCLAIFHLGHTIYLPVTRYTLRVETFNHHYAVAGSGLL